MLQNDGGQGLVEYSIIIALIAIVCLIGVRAPSNDTPNAHSSASTSKNTSGK